MATKILVKGFHYNQGDTVYCFQTELFKYAGLQDILQTLKDSREFKEKYKSFNMVTIEKLSRLLSISLEDTKTVLLSNTVTLKSILESYQNIRQIELDALTIEYGIETKTR